MNKKELLKKLDDAAAVEGAGTMSSLLKEAAEAVRSHCVVWFKTDEKMPMPGQQILFSVYGGYVCEGYLDTNGRFLKHGGFVMNTLDWKVDYWTPMPKAPFEVKAHEV